METAEMDHECLHAGDECSDPERCRCRCDDCNAAYEKANTEEEMESGS